MKRRLSTTYERGITTTVNDIVMILLFRGSWRSTLIVATSIPLSILSSILVLSALGKSMNVMTPMALGFGDGGEQYPPLGRSVIGGLLAATLATLFIVPIAYSTLRGRASVRHPKHEPVQELAA